MGLYPSAITKSLRLVTLCTHHFSQSKIDSETSESKMGLSSSMRSVTSAPLCRIMRYCFASRSMTQYLNTSADSPISRGAFTGSVCGLAPGAWWKRHRPRGGDGGETEA
jgi:hypothetical protein